jgi:hypothetical protein
MNASPSRDPQAALAALLGPRGSEVSCEQCFDQLDRYVELELAGSDAHPTMPGVPEHLQGCPACAEDRDSLRDLLLSESIIAPE